MRLVVDIAIRVERNKILLIKRTKPPFQDKLVLPGGHMEDTDAGIVHAAVREVEEETGLTFDLDRFRPIMILDGQNRDPRPERRISFVYLIDIMSEDAIQNCRAGSDAASIQLRDLKSLTLEEIGFDHWKVIRLLKS